MTYEELKEKLKEARNVRELLTEEAEAAYRAETDPKQRVLIRADLLEIAKNGRFGGEFKKVFSVFEKTVTEEEKTARSQARAEQRTARAAENKIRFEVLENPHPAMRSFTYEINDDGVFLGNDRVCTQPVLIFGKFRNIESGEDSLCLTYHDGHCWREVIEKREVLFSPAKIIRLAAYGLSVHGENAKKFIRFLDTFEQENSLFLEPKLSFSHLGWLDRNRFAPYDPALTFAGQENKDLFSSVKEAGSAEKWRAYIRELRKNIPLRLTMAASFASPLIKKAGANPFILHLWGVSGTGKTIALMVSASIWGDPAVGQLVKILNATQNSMVNLAAFFYSVPVFLDELQTIVNTNWNSIEALVMALTEGLERGRMEYDRSRPSRSWNCCFLFSGEEPIVKNSSGGGVANRLIEIECTEPLVTNGNQAANFVRANHGHAGKVYTNYIKEKDIPALFHEQQAQLLQETGTTDKQAASMALMMVADRLAGECLFPGETPLTVQDIRPYLKTERDVDISERAYAYICGVIAANQSHFEINGAPATSNQELWGKITDGVCTINKVIMEKLLVAGGFSFDTVKKRWAASGKLLKTSNGRYVHKDSYGGAKAYSARIIVQEDDYRAANEELPL